MNIAQIEHTEQYDKARRDLQFDFGDFVLKRIHPLSARRYRRGFATSLANRREVSYRVPAKTSRLSYRPINYQSGDEEGPVHVTDLKQFFMVERVRRFGNDAECRCSLPFLFLFFLSLFLRTLILWGREVN